MKEEANKQELETINRMMDQLETEIKKKRDQKTLNDPEMFLTYMNRALETYSIIAEELGNCLYVLGMQNHYLTTRKLFRLAQQQINSVLKFALRYFVKRSDDLDRDIKLPQESYSFYQNLAKSPDPKTQISQGQGQGEAYRQSPEPRISQPKVEERDRRASTIYQVGHNSSSPQKTSNLQKRNSLYISTKNKTTAQTKDSPTRGTSKTETSTHSSQHGHHPQEKHSQFHQKSGANHNHTHHAQNNHHNHSQFRSNTRDYESSHAGYTQTTEDENEEEEKDQIEYEKMRKEVDNFLKKRSNLEALQSAGTANELRQVLRQLEAAKRKARGIEEEEDDDRDIHEANIGEITDNALGAFAMAQKKTAKRVIKRMTTETKTEEVIQIKQKAETGVNTDEVMSQILRKMYQQELDPVMEKLKKEIEYLEGRVKNREDEYNRLNLKLIEAIREHHNCADDKSELDFKIISLREENDKLAKDNNNLLAQLKEYSNKEAVAKFTDLASSNTSNKDDRTREEVLSYQRRIKNQQNQIDELQMMVNRLNSQLAQNEGKEEDDQHNDRYEGGKYDEYYDNYPSERSNEINSPYLYDKTRGSPTKQSRSKNSDRSRQSNISPSPDEIRTDKAEKHRERLKSIAQPNSPVKRRDSLKPEKIITKTQHRPSFMATSHQQSSHHQNHKDGSNNDVDKTPIVSHQGSLEIPENTDSMVHLKSPNSQLSEADPRTPFEETPELTPNQTPLLSPSKKGNSQAESIQDVRYGTQQSLKLSKTESVSSTSKQDLPDNNNMATSGSSNQQPLQRKKTESNKRKESNEISPRIKEKGADSSKREALSSSMRKQDPMPTIAENTRAQNQISKEPDSGVKISVQGPKDDRKPPRKEESNASKKVTSQENIEYIEKIVYVEKDGQKVKQVVKQVPKDSGRAKENLSNPVEYSRNDPEPEQGSKQAAQKRPRMVSRAVQADMDFSQPTTPVTKQRQIGENPDAQRVVVKLLPKGSKEPIEKDSRAYREKEFKEREFKEKDSKEKDPKEKNRRDARDSKADRENGDKDYHFSEFDSDEKEDEWPGAPQAMSRDKNKSINKFSSPHVNQKYGPIMEEKYEETPKKVIKSSSNVKAGLKPLKEGYRSIPKLSNDISEYQSQDEYYSNEPQTMKMSKTQHISIFQTKTSSKTPKLLMNPESISSLEDEEEHRRSMPIIKVVSNKMVRKLQDRLQKEELLDIQYPDLEVDPKRGMYRAMLKQAQIDPSLMKIFKRRNRSKDRDEGEENEDEEIVDFDNFDSFVARMEDRHSKCGPNCVHLMRFFNKIGYYTNVQNRKVFELKQGGALWDVPYRKKHRQRLPMIPRRKPKIIPPIN